MGIRYEHEGVVRQKLNKPLRLKTKILRAWYTLYWDIYRNCQDKTGPYRQESIGERHHVVCAEVREPQAVSS